ncbi:MAG: M48 family metalloprotease [Oligoflexia bacterium]|nr:M48 family metalloprotease [Oligoflexia bacterium]MBF0365249.1 M48 family metalloprotease [Oligoflexia bacterium]
MFMSMFNLFRSLLSLFVLLFLLFFISSCASNQEKSRMREGDNRGQETGMSVADEKRMTAETLTEIQKDYPVVKNESVQQYVRAIGAKLVHASGLEGNPYHYTFTAVEAPYVNAFALPAGTIFITAPLMKLAESEAELAGVIGHEIGHVVARHTAERIDKAEKEKGKNILQNIGGGVLGGIAGLGLGKLLCKDGDTECMLKAIGGGAVVGVGGTLLVQKYHFMANSREDEMESDRIGFRIAVKAGYSKEHLGRFYEKLLEMEKQNRGKKPSGLMALLSDAMSTHPPSEERVKQMHELSVAAPAQASPIISSKKFEETKQRLP